MSIFIFRGKQIERGIVLKCMDAPIIRCYTMLLKMHVSECIEVLGNVNENYYIWSENVCFEAGTELDNFVPKQG